jgi:uncharacterized protein (TIGR02246 family)
MPEKLSLGLVDKLAAKQVCRDLVLQAAALTDTQQYEAFAALFADDGELVRPGGQPLQGRTAIVESYRARPAGRITRHLVTNTLVHLDSPTAAHAISTVLLWTGSASDEAGPFGRRAHPRQVVGEFEDRFVLTAGGWRIRRREARFLLHIEAHE